jgi:uncharacterized membrane protein
MAQFALLISILAIFCFTPLGQIPMFGGMVATLAAIPVVVAALALGVGAGAAMGGIAGLFSLIIWTFFPPMPILAFIFTPFYSLGDINGNLGSLLICFVPRIGVGAIAALSRRALEKALPGKEVLCFAISGALGSLANTFGYVLGVWLFFGPQITQLMNTAVLAVLGGVIVTNGLPEAFVSALAAGALCKPIKLLARGT